MWRMARPFSAALLIVALALGVARADFITKKDGTVIEGEVTHRDESRVVVTTKDGTVIDIPRSAIDRITKERPDANGKKPEPAEPTPPPPSQPAAEPKATEPAEVDSATQPEPVKATPAPVGSATKPKAPKKDGI